MNWQYIQLQIIEMWEMLNKDPMTIAIIKVSIVVLTMLLVAASIHSGLHYVLKIRYNRTQSNAIFNTAIIMSVISGVWLGYTLFASGQIPRSNTFKQLYSTNETIPAEPAAAMNDKKHSFKTQKQWIQGQSPEECQKAYGNDRTTVTKCQSHWNTIIKPER